MRFSIRRLRRGLLLNFAVMVVCTLINNLSYALSFPVNQELLAIHDGSLDGVPSHFLYRINTTTGLATMIGDTHYATLQSLTTGPDGKLYSWDFSAGLVTIDPLTGAGSDVSANGSGVAPLMQSLAFSPSGVLFGVTSSGNQNRLYTIDTTTGLATFVSQSPLLHNVQTVRGIEFLGTRLVGVAWYFDDPTSPFYDINATTAALSFVGLTGYRSLNSLAQDQNGTLYSSSSVEGVTSSCTVIAINPQTGQSYDSLTVLAPLLAPDTLDVRALTVRTVFPIPEPGALGWVACCIWILGGRYPLPRRRHDSG